MSVLKSNEISNFSIIGLGRVGSALLLALEAAGFHCSNIITRRPDVVQHSTALQLSTPDSTCKPCDIWFICVPDDQIRQTAETLLGSGVTLTGVTVAHVSGARDASILQVLSEAGALTASFHPMQTFTPLAQPSVFHDVMVSLEGHPEACKHLHQLCKRLGAQPQIMGAEEKLQRHLAGVIVSNFLSALVLTAASVLDKPPQEAESFIRRHYGGIMRQTLDNILTKGFPDAITGPAFRGDLETLQLHLLALKEHPQAEALYRAASSHLSGYPMPDLPDEIQAKRNAAMRLMLDLKAK